MTELFAIPACNLLSLSWGPTNLLSSVYWSPRWLPMIQGATSSRGMIQGCKSSGEEADWTGAGDDENIRRRVSSEVNSVNDSVKLGSRWRWRILLRSHGKVKKILTISQLLKLETEGRHGI